MANSKMLQALIDGQRSIKEELIKLINGVKKEVVGVKKEVVGVKKEVLKNRKRIDKLGLELSELSDDAPTINEFDKLEKRVSKLEHQTA